MNIGKLNPSYSRSADSNTILLLHLNGDIRDSQTTPLVFANSSTPVTFANTTPKFSGTSYAVFNGTSSFLSLPNNNIFNFGSSDFTIDFWINFSSFPSTYQSPIGFTNAGENIGWEIYVTATQLDTYAQGVSQLSTSITWSLNTWYHIAWVRNGNNFYVFINGVLVNSGTGSGSLVNNSSTPLVISSAPWGSSFIDGFMSEMRISKIARWTSNFTLPTAPYLGRDQWYANTYDPLDVLLVHFQGANGATTFKDSSIKNRTLTPNGTVSISSTTAKFGVSSGSFQTQGSYLNMGNSSDFIFTGDFTMECFFNTNNPVTTRQQNILFFFDSSGNYTTFDWDGGGNWDFRVYTPGGSLLVDLSGAADTIVGGVWYHVAVVRYGNTWTIYRDGVSKKSVTAAVTYPTYNGSIQLGGVAPQTLYQMYGYLQDVRITNGYARYTSNFTAPTASFIGTEGSLPNPDTNTVLLLHGDGTDLSTVFIDSSLSGKTVTSNGAASISNQGKILFNGSNQYLTAGVASNWTFLSNTTALWTIDFWFKPANFTNVQYFFATDSSSSNSVGTECLLNANRSIYFDILTGNGGQWPINITTPAGLYPNDTVNWHHLAFTYNQSLGTNNFNIFLDGVLVYTASKGAVSPSSATPYQALQIGALPSSNTYMTGNLTNFRVSNIVRWTSNFNPTFSVVSDVNTVLLLKFQGNINDSSTNNYTVTNNNNATVFYPGILPLGNVDGGAMYFDGSTSSVQVPVSTDLQFGSSNFTIDFWVNFITLPTSGNTATLIANINTNNSDGYQMNIVNNSGTYQISIYSNNGVNTGFTATLVVGTWYHIAWVANGATDTIYLNGTSIGSHSTSGSINASNNPFTLGYYNNFSNQYFNGYMDEFRVTKGLARWTANFTVPTVPYIDATTWFGNKVDPRDVLLLHMDTASFIDSSFNPKTLTNTSVSQSTSVRRFGTSSASFNGSSSKLFFTSDTTVQFGNSNFTIDFWFNCANLSAQPQVINQIGGSTTDGLIFNLATSGVDWRIYDTSDNLLLNLNCSATLNTNTWYHVAFVRNGNTWTIYLNGASIGSLTSSITYPTFTGQFSVGGPATSNGGAFFQGYLDEVRVTNGLARYTSNFTPSTIPYVGTEGYSKEVDPLDVLICHFDGTDGTQQFIDSSVNDASITTNGTAIIVNKNGAVSNWNSSYFNGTSGYLSVPYSSNINFTSGDFTMEAWINPSVLPVGGQAISLFSARGTSNTNGYIFYLSNTGSVVTINPVALNSSTNIVSNTFNLPNYNINTWNHIAWVRHGNVWSVYWNGGLVGSVTASGNIGTFSNALLIGADVYSGPLGDYFTGYMSDVKFSNVARYTATFVPPARGSATSDVNTELLLAGGSVKDTSSTAATVTDTNVISYPNGPAIANGGIGYFDGSTGYLTVPSSNNFNFGASDFTIDFWMNLPILPSPSAGTNYVFARDNNEGSGVAGFLGWVANNSGTLSFKFEADASNNPLITVVAPYPFVINTWYHIACVRHGSSWSVYVNGVLCGSGTASVTVGTLSSTPLTVGGFANSSVYFTGWLDEFRITNGIARWTSNFTPPTTHYIGREDVLGRNIELPGFVKIADFTSLGAESTFTVNVDGDTDLEYSIMTYNPSSSVGYINCRLNGDSGSNYGYQYFDNTSGSITGGHGSNTFFDVSNNYGFEQYTTLFTPAGLVKTTLSHGLRYNSGTSLLETILDGYVWNNTANVTTINFYANSGNFSAGTRIIVFARRSQ